MSKDVDIFDYETDLLTLNSLLRLGDRERIVDKLIYDLNKWRSAEINIGVFGSFQSAKSALINTLRGLVYIQPSETSDEKISGKNNKNINNKHVAIVNYEFESSSNEEDADQTNSISSTPTVYAFPEHPGIKFHEFVCY